MRQQKLKQGEKKVHPLKEFIKKKKISYKYLMAETGYSKVYISQVLNGHFQPSVKFEKLMLLAVKKFSNRHNDELIELIREKGNQIRI